MWLFYQPLWFCFLSFSAECTFSMSEDEIKTVGS